MARVIVFDVNETMLDLGALDLIFQELFGDPAVRKEWFGQVLQSALVATVTGVYKDFGAIAEAALEMTAASRGGTLTARDRERVKKGMRRLPPHPEVRQGLDLLSRSGMRLAALTNSSGDAAEEQLKHAGLYRYFEKVLSVDEVKVFKPHPDVYKTAAKRLGVKTRDIRMVAAHSWDVAGAMRAGCAAAFVARPGKVLDPLSERPDVVGEDLRTTAEKIMEIEKA